MSYADLQRTLGPPWLQRANGRSLMTEVGAEKDALLDRNRQAVIANVPGKGPADALTSSGADRMLPIAVGESVEAYAERLRLAWEREDGWAFAGSHGGILQALARAGFPTGATGCTIIQRTKLYTYLDTSGPSPVVVRGTHAGWTWDDSGPAFWNRFGIVIGQDVAGLEPDTDLADLFNAVVRLWKPVKGLYCGARVIPSGIAWGWPIGIAWGDSGLDWGDGSGAGNRLIPPWWA